MKRCTAQIQAFLVTRQVTSMSQTCLQRYIEELDSRGWQRGGQVLSSCTTNGWEGMSEHWRSFQCQCISGTNSHVVGSRHVPSRGLCCEMGVVAGCAFCSRAGTADSHARFKLYGTRPHSEPEITSCMQPTTTTGAFYRVRTHTSTSCAVGRKEEQFTTLQPCSLDATSNRPSCATQGAQ